MKNNLLKVLFVLFSVLTISCSKNDDEPITPIAPIAPVQADGFYYAENGSSTITKAASAQVNGAFDTIIAKDASNVTLCEINLTALTVGTYTIDNTNNAFAFVRNGVGTFIGSAGTITITSNSGGKLSGSFNCTAGSGVAGLNSVSGTFTNITIN